MTQYEQEPLFYGDVTYWQHPDDERRTSSGYVTVSHEQIQEIACPDLRAVLGRFSMNGHQIEDGLYAIPIVKADGTLSEVTRTPHKRTQRLTGSGSEL